MIELTSDQKRELARSLVIKSVEALFGNSRSCDRHWSNGKIAVKTHRSEDRQIAVDEFYNKKGELARRITSHLNSSHQEELFTQYFAASRGDIEGSDVELSDFFIAIGGDVIVRAIEPDKRNFADIERDRILKLIDEENATLKFELKAPDKKNPCGTAQGYILTIDGERLKHVSNVVLSFPASDRISVEVTQLTKNEQGFVLDEARDGLLQTTRKFVVKEFPSLSLEVEKFQTRGDE